MANEQRREWADARDVIDGAAAMVRDRRAQVLKLNDYLGHIRDEVRRGRERLVAPSNDGEASHLVAARALGSLDEELAVADEELRVCNEELTEQREALEREVLRWQAAFEHAPDAAAITSPQGVICVANRAMVQLLAASQAFLAKRSLIHFVVRGDCAAFREQLASAASGVTTTRRLSLRPRHAKSPVEAEVHVTPIAPQGRDGHELRWTVRPVAAAPIGDDAARDEMLAMIAHDLRSPLSVIGAASDALKRFAAHDERAREHCAVVRRAVDAMSRQVADLLEHAALRAGHLTMTCADEDVAAIAVEIARAFAPLGESRGVAIEARLPRGEHVARCDRGRIAQIIANLVDNAVRVSPQLGTVTIGVARRGARVRVEVEDEGPGLDGDVAEHVFDRYWHAKSATHAGAGLGLAIARGIIDAHGGVIGVAPARPRGTIFFFEIPAAGSSARSSG